MGRVRDRQYHLFTPVVRCSRHAVGTDLGPPIVRASGGGRIRLPATGFGRVRDAPDAPICTRDAVGGGRESVPLIWAALEGDQLARLRRHRHTGGSMLLSTVPAGSRSAQVSSCRQHIVELIPGRGNRSQVSCWAHESIRCRMSLVGTFRRRGGDCSRRWLKTGAALPMRRA